MSLATSDAHFNVAAPFYEQSVLRPEAPALSVAGAVFSYAELAGLARRVSGWLAGSSTRTGKVGILASRSVEAYTGVLGTLWSGAAYVPINPKTPEERLLHILRITQLDALIVDCAGANQLSDRVLKAGPAHILAGSVNPSLLDAAWRAGVTVGNLFDLPEGGPETPIPISEDALAYIIFTSGTTGVPKGVMIEAGSVLRYRTVVQERCGFRPEDRVSQVAELTFDNSVLDLFVTWAAGASLYVVPESQLMAPGKFIRENQLTIWFSVPSIALFMLRLGMLKPGAFPSLRCSIFAGEALPLASAQAWQLAAPNSVIENFYGPTEVTVDCLAQRLEDPPNVTRDRGVLAIGKPFPGIDAAIVDAALDFLPPEQPGELIVSGRQLARGYFGDSELTLARFPTIAGKRWYRTGDLAYRDSSGTFHHLGRIDNQVKVLGNRVELEEVEAHLREILQTDLVAAVAWPVKDGSAAGLVAFHCGSATSPQVVREAMLKRVPCYMIPEQIHEIESMPLGSTGKIDRKALFQKLAEQKV